jgi:sugar lactone lactonase YvrE
MKVRVFIAGAILLFAPGVNAQGIITTVAGNGTAGFGGDGGPATSARLNSPFGVAVDSSGNLFIADFQNHRIRKVDAITGIITTVAGSGPTGFLAGGFSGDGDPATSARLNSPFGVAVDSSGNLFIADSFNDRIRRVDASTGIITTVAGGGFVFGDGGPATSARLDFPSGVAVDSSGNLFIADTLNERIRRVDASTGIITTVAGGGFVLGDGGPATSATLVLPFGMALDAVGNLFIADRFNDRLRKVDAATGIITTVAGIGTAGFSGDGGPATSASLAEPVGVALGAAGNLFIADSSNQRIRRVVFVLTVDIDIKPGNDPNAINPASRGLIPVAILTTVTFDATTVSPITVRFGPAGASLAHQLGHLEDVDNDGDLDLVLHFRTQEAGIQCGDTEASLTGETFDGQAIQGSDSIVTVGCG